MELFDRFEGLLMIRVNIICDKAHMDRTRLCFSADEIT